MGNWQRDRNLLKGDYTDTFPLWIHPWVSGIYALDDPKRVARPGDKIPAILTAYRDELGEATLMMHVTDYRSMEGSEEIEWCHWTAVRWRGDMSVSMYGRVEEESWRLTRVMDLPLTDRQHQQLVWNREEFADGKDLATALLPYLPLAPKLSVWDGREPLYCCHEYLDFFRDEPFVQDVLNLEVIPVQEVSKWPREDDEKPRLVIVSPLMPPGDFPTREFIRGTLAELKPPPKDRATPRRPKTSKAHQAKKAQKKQK